MRFFPIFLDLHQRRVVVVGGGECAVQKVRLLMKTSARIVVIAPSPSPAMRRLAEVNRPTGDSPHAAASTPVHTSASVQLHRRAFVPSDVATAALVYAATGEAVLDGEVARAACVHNIPVNAVDRPRHCTFYTPALVDRAPVVIAIGTEGTAPVLARQLKARIETMLSPTLGRVARYAHQLRASVHRRIGAGAGLGTGAGLSGTALATARRAFWESFFSGAVSEMVRAGRMGEAERAVHALLQQHTCAPAGHITWIHGNLPDAELLTLKAVRELQEADVIVHAHRINADILEYARRDAKRVCIRPTSTARIHRLLAIYAKRKCRVVYVHSDEERAHVIAEAQARDMPAARPQCAEVALAHIAHVHTSGRQTHHNAPRPVQHQ